MSPRNKKALGARSENVRRIERRARRQGISEAQLAARLQQSAEAFSAPSLAVQHRMPRHFTAQHRQVLAFIMDPTNSDPIRIAQTGADVKTALIKSFMSVPVTTATGASGNPGAFSAVIQPKLGAGEQNIVGFTMPPNRFKIALAADVDYGTVDWSLPSSWDASYALDDAAEHLIGATTYAGHWVQGGTADQFNWLGTAATESDSIGETRYDPSTGSFALEPGEMLRWNSFSTTLGSTVNVHAYVDRTCTNPAVGGTDADYIAGFMTSPTSTYCSAVFVAYNRVFVRMEKTNVGAPVTYRADITIAPVGPGMGGFIRSVRPLSMSVWAECVANATEDGGSITMALLQGDSVEYEMFTPQANGGAHKPAHLVNRVENSYNGKLRNGAYGFWIPHDMDSRNLKTAADSNKFGYSSIVVSGQHDDATGGKSPLILKVCTIYAYTCVSRAVKQDYADIPAKVYDECIEYLRNVRCTTVMSNSHHKSVISRIVGSFRDGSAVDVANNLHSAVKALLPSSVSGFY